MDKKKIANMRKNNMKLFPIYEMIGLDLIFFYAIKVLFLTQIKGLSASDIVLGDAFYAFCAIIIQIPVSMVARKMGPKKV